MYMFNRSDTQTQPANQTISHESSCSAANLVQRKNWFITDIIGSYNIYNWSIITEYNWFLTDYKLVHN
jgi:hypothetical protein